MTNISICGNLSEQFVDRDADVLSISNPGFIALNQFFFWFPIVVCILAVGIWLAFKARFEYTRIRPTALLVMTCIASILNSLLNHYTAAFQSVMPCAPLIIMLVLIVPVVAGSLTSRMIIFYLLSRFSEEKAHRALTQMSATGFAFDITGETSDPVLSMCENSKIVMALAFRILTFQAPIAIGDKTQESKTTLQALQYATSNYGVASMVLSLVVPFLVIATIILLTNLDFLDCIGCHSVRTVTLYTAIAVSLWCLLLGMIMWLRVRKLPDPWGLRAECFYGLLWAISATIWFGTDVFLPPEQMKEMKFVFYYPLTVSILAMVVVNSFVQLALGFHHERKKTMNLARSTAGMVSLDEILENPAKAEAFERHLIRELGIESLLFIRDAENWKSRYYDIAPSARKSRAKKMFLTYIATNGIYAVNIPDSMNRAITKTLASPEDDVPETLFDDAVKEIKHLLTVGAVARFVESEAYKNAAKQLSVHPRRPSAAV